MPLEGPSAENPTFVHVMGGGKCRFEQRFGASEGPSAENTSVFACSERPSAENTHVFAASEGPSAEHIPVFACSGRGQVQLIFFVVI